MMEREFHFFVEPEICSEDSEGSDDAEGSSGFEDFFDGSDKTEGRSLIVRLDKWLWAARFFKTRALARAAVEAGKIYYNGERSKPSREIEVGAILQIRHGRIEKTIIVKGLSTRRRSTDEALQLFEETEESKSLREQLATHYSPSHYNQPNGQLNGQPNRDYYNPHYQEQSSFAHQELSQDQKPTRFLRRIPARPEQRQDLRSPYGAQKHNRTPRTPSHFRQQTTGYPPQHTNQNNGHHHPNHGGYSQNSYPNHADYSHNPYQQPGYNRSSYPGRANESGHSNQPPQNYNNPVYNSRQHPHHSYNSHHPHGNPYNHSHYSQPNYNPAVPGNKTEPQTELD